MIDLEELRRAAEDENADGIWISPEAAHYLLDRIEKAEADIAAVRELTFMIRPRYLPAYIRNRLDAPDPAQAAEKDATRCPDHPKAAIGYTDPPADLDPDDTRAYIAWRTGQRHAELEAS